MPTSVIELQQAVIEAAYANARGAAAVARRTADRGDEAQPVDAAKAAQFGLATRELCNALTDLQRLPIKRPAAAGGGPAPDLYP